jgi:N-acetylglucosamine kinase-like BadF-type ATPase
MYVVGVDGGTTKTIALVADLQGRIVGAARGGGSNWSGEDVTIPMEVVADTVRRAAQNAGIAADAMADEIAVGVFTLAGADWLEDHTRRRAVLEQARIARQVMVKNDAFGGLRAGLTRPYGMVLAVGTGMNAAVITPDGQEWAFGYYETTGGGGTIARRAFTAVLRAEDGRGEPTLLTGKVLERLGFPTVEAMLRAFVLRQIEHNRLYGITPLVFDAALEGDAVAVDLLVAMGKELAEYITTLARRFTMQTMPFEVVLAGSVFKGVGPVFVDTIVQEIHRIAPLAQIVRARHEPAVGSVLLALDACSIPAGEQVFQNLLETAPDARFFDTARSVDNISGGAVLDQIA